MEPIAVDPVSEATIARACGDRPLPAMGTIEQVWETDPVPPDAVEGRARAALDALPFDGVPDGGSVAVGVGSRGIGDLPAIVRGVVGGLTERGYRPFVVPAMGSHASATAAGQREKLATLGISPGTVGCEVRATMETAEVGTIGRTDDPIVCDANAAAADAVLPINRVKPHTDFDGRVESGLSKMLVVGFGKQRGARAAHERAVTWGFSRMLERSARALLDALPVVGGVALVEDQHDETATIEGVPPDAFLDREATLLERAYDLLPTLPFEDLDVLVVDRMGKEISGAGLDPNVVGRRTYGLVEPDPETPDVKRILVRALTGASNGNASGLGLADLVHRDVVDAMDTEKTIVNALTSSAPCGARIPPVVESDRAGLLAALSTIGASDPESVRVARIADTMRLKRLYVSTALVEEARDRADLRVVEEPRPVSFTDAGALIAPTPDSRE